MQLIYIGAGGALGAVLRYLVSAWIQGWGRGSFPVGTLAVNFLGCLAIGLLGSLLVKEGHRGFVLIGLLGGFTTFSTFGWETLMLLNAGRVGAALANALLSMAVCLLAVWIGFRISSETA